MAQKLILTEHQHSLIVNEIINEMIKDIDENTLLSEGVVNEGVWEKIKYGLSKLGRYKAGGKIFGKGKIDQEAAAKIQAIIDKKGNEVIKNLDAKIKEENPEFPNNEKEVEFLNTIMSVSAVYDSLIAATQKDPKDEGYLPIDAANGIINDLREYVKKFLDVDLKAIYSVVDEAEGNVIEISEEELKGLDEAWGLNENINEGFFDNLGDKLKKAGKNLKYSVSSPKECEERAQGIVDLAISKGITDSDKLKYLHLLELNNCREELGLGRLANWDGPSTLASRYEEGVEDSIMEAEAKDVRSALKAKKGDGGEFDSERMKTLKSNKLPLLLAGIGGSLGAFSWLVNTDWFKHLFDKPFNYTDTETTTELIQQKSEVFNDIKPGEGVYKLLGRVTDNPLDANSKPQDFIESLKEIGGGDAHKGVDLLCQKGGVMMKPDEAAKGLHDLVNNPNQYQTMNDMFKGAASGTGKLGPVDTTLYGTIAGSKLTSILVKMVPQVITKVAIKTGVKTGAGYAVAKGFGAVLGPIGVGLLATGALVKLMRMKGQKQSRAATLNDLYQSIRNIEGGAGVIEPEGETTDIKGAQDPNIISDKNKEGGDKGTGKKGGKGKSAFDNDLYNHLKNLFKFVVNNRKMLGVRGADNVGTGGAAASVGSKGNKSTTETFKKGDRATYKGRNVTVTIPDVSPGYTQIDADGDGPEKKTYAVKTADLKKALSEGKYIKDKRLIQFLQKSLSFDKLKSFENFIDKIEIIRDKIKEVDAGDDKAIQNFLNQLDSNPIMATNFAQLFAVDSQNPQAVNALKAFIDDLFVSVYSGKFKYGNMIDKMAQLGDGNINKLKEADKANKAYSAKSPNKAFAKDAQDRGRFKKNLINFLSTCISLFQYLHKKRSENNNNQFKGGEKPKGDKSEPKKPEPVTPPSSKPEGGEEKPEVSESPKLNEELSRIKNIMKQII
jgi:hypothetical protein